jgi:4a-hydroxytetrahydrobiopterin dehydratase
LSPAAVEPTPLDARLRPLGADDRLDAPALESQLAQLPGWSVRDGALERDYRFPDFDSAMAFAQATASLAARQDHHPELRIEWGRCIVRWHTHSAHGITMNDVVCAALLDAPGE